MLKKLLAGFFPPTPTEMPRHRSLSLRDNEQGATAIEYGLIAALIAVAAITALQGLSGSRNHTNHANSAAPTNQTR